MEKMNFRQRVFRGSLRQVLDQGRLEIADSAQRMLDAHEWLRRQLNEKDNIFPMRKFAGYQLRGSMHPFGMHGSSFMPVDNEPLAHLYHWWTRSGKIDHSIGRALIGGHVVASWRCDVPKPFPAMRFTCVKAPFRERGFKLAHIHDAARGIDTCVGPNRLIAIRFLRTLSPLNVFLFPNRKWCGFRVISGNSHWRPEALDWSEDLELRRIALGWMIEWIGKPLLDACGDFGSPRIEPNPGWKRIAAETMIEVSPKDKISNARAFSKPLIRPKKPARRPEREDLRTYSLSARGERSWAESNQAGDPQGGMLPGRQKTGNRRFREVLAEVQRQGTIRTTMDLDKAVRWMLFDMVRKGWLVTTQVSGDAP